LTRVARHPRLVRRRRQAHAGARDRFS
jgi:hypothetical protein